MKPGTLQFRDVAHILRILPPRSLEMQIILKIVKDYQKCKELNKQANVHSGPRV